jgi:hypothetical protein
MPHFTKGIDTPRGKFTFHFNRIFTAGGDNYHISFVDNKHKAQMFNMIESGGRWNIVDLENLPDWIVTIEQTIGVRYP